MSTPENPALADLLPHAEAMLLLSRVLRHQGDETVCSVVIDEQRLFRDAEGSVPAWIGLEYMAQCIAAHAGLVAQAQGRPPQLGFLLGSRGLRFHADRFRPGQTLAVTARRVWGRSQGMLSFECSLADAASGALLAEGRLNCFLPAGGEPGAAA